MEKIRENNVESKDQDEDKMIIEEINNFLGAIY